MFSFSTYRNNRMDICSTPVDIYMITEKEITSLLNYFFRRLFQRLPPGAREATEKSWPEVYSYWAHKSKDDWTPGIASSKINIFESFNLSFSFHLTRVLNANVKISRSVIIY